MQSTLRERYRSRSFSAPGSTTSVEARRVFESALRHAASQHEEQSQHSIVVNGSAESSDVCTELGQELVTASSQIDEKLQQIIKEIVTAVREQNVDLSRPFYEAVESIINRKITVDTFINVMVFCITLVRRYKAESPSSWQDKAVWITEQVYELMASAYQRYHIDDWIREQGGWTGVLKLVRTKCQTFTDYAIQPVFARRQTAVAAGTIVVFGAVGLIIWYNW